MHNILLRLLRQMSHVVWSVCLCVVVTDMLCKKTTETIEMPFGADCYGSRELCVRWWSRSNESIRSREG